MARKTPKCNHNEADKREEIREALEEIEPKTELGRILIELSLRGLDEGVEPLDADEIMEYLGRPPCD